jgi:hypothetical protein
VVVLFGSVRIKTWGRVVLCSYGNKIKEKERGKSEIGIQSM